LKEKAGAAVAAEAIDPSAAACTTGSCVDATADGVCADIVETDRIIEF
jgi:hypothetical protein